MAIWVAFLASLGANLALIVLAWMHGGLLCDLRDELDVLKQKHEDLEVRGRERAVGIAMTLTRYDRRLKTVEDVNRNG